jgi:hypothetical protein
MWRNRAGPSHLSHQGQRQKLPNSAPQHPTIHQKALFVVPTSRVIGMLSFGHPTWKKT